MENTGVLKPLSTMSWIGPGSPEVSVKLAVARWQRSISTHSLVANCYQCKRVLRLIKLFINLFLLEWFKLSVDAFWNSKLKKKKNNGGNPVFSSHLGSAPPIVHLAALSSMFNDRRDQSINITRGPSRNPIPVETTNVYTNRHGGRKFPFNVRQLVETRANPHGFFFLTGIRLILIRISETLVALHICCFLKDTRWEN